MSGRRISLLIAATALFGAACGAAQAADKAKPVDLTVHSDMTSMPSTGMRALRWDARKGRWGVTLNMDQSDTRPQSGNDVQAGAYAASHATGTEPIGQSTSLPMVKSGSGS